MEEIKKSNRGGKREGAGRKRGAESSIISFKMMNDLLEAFPSEINRDGKIIKFNRSEYINMALRKQMKKDGLI